jgi:hypothetical protein
VNLRCFAVLSPRSDSKIALEFPYINLETEWDISSLPWSLLPVGTQSGKREADTELDQALIQGIEGVANAELGGKHGFAAQLAFLYLYMTICGSRDNA